MKYGGLKFLEAAHVKDALALLRVLENPYDEVAWFRVLQLPEGMGPTTARRLMDELAVRREPTEDATTPSTGFLERPLSVPKGAADGIRSLRSRAVGLHRRRAAAARRAARTPPRVPRAGGGAGVRVAGRRVWRTSSSSPSSRRATRAGAVSSPS